MGITKLYEHVNHLDGSFLWYFLRRTISRSCSPAVLGEVCVGSVGLTHPYQELHHKLINGVLDCLWHHLQKKLKTAVKI